MINYIIKCDAAIDKACGKWTVPQSMEDIFTTTENSLERLKNSKDFWGFSISNSREFNNLADSFTNGIKFMQSAKVNGASAEEYREMIRKIEEAAVIYVRAKRVQKGYDTKDVTDLSINKQMLGRSRTEKGPCIRSEQGKERYDFAVSVLIGVNQMKWALDYYEEKQKNDDRDRERTAAFQKNRDNFMAHKKRLESKFKAFESGEKVLKENTETFNKQAEKVKKLSDSIAETYEKGMDVWSTEFEEYKNAIKALNAIAKDHDNEIDESSLESSFGIQA